MDYKVPELGDMFQAKCAIEGAVYISYEGYGEMMVMSTPMEEGDVR